MQIAQSSSTPFSLWMPFAKVDVARRTVAGYATTPDRDMDGEIITLDAVKAALPDYMQWGNIREMHTNRAVGVADATKTKMDTTGLWLTAKIVDDEAWKKCVEGVYKGFSIGGRKEAVAEADPSTITAIKLVEISIVDRPANPSCRFEVQKRAKKGEIAHLVRTFRRTPEQRALRKMAQVVEELAKSGPPAAHDGFSLPAKTANEMAEQSVSAPCTAHGVTGCPECTEKRDFSSKERDSAAASGAAMSDGSFPIYTQNDLDNAWGLRGNSNHPKSSVVAHIRSRAQALGLKMPSKDKKGKKAKKAARTARGASIRAARSALALSASLSLPAIEADGLVESGHELDLKKGDGGTATPQLPTFLTLRKGKNRISERSSAQRLAAVVGQKATADDHGVNSLEDLLMTIDNGVLERALAKVVRKSRAPTRADRMMRAGRDLKKARKAAKDMEECMKALHAMHKTAYLAKQASIIKAGGKKPKPDDDDDDDFDHQSAMEKVQKAYSDLSTLKTMMKSARVNIAKAAGRSGQRGQEAGDADPGFYEVPPGVKDLSPSAMARTGPGGGESGSEPPIQALDVEWKSARAANMVKRGYVSRDEADALARAAAAEAKVEVLEKMPANGGGRRPVLFDARHLTSEPSRAKVLMEGVNEAGLVSDDESVRKSAVGTLLGNMIINGMGKSVLDPDFRGRGGI
jgi:phage head maturation protease